MRFHQSKKHVIDVTFPLAILFVFAVSALLVLLLSVHIYGEQTDKTKQNYESFTPLSYITEKVRQNDAKGTISIEELDGISCLTLHGSSSDATYSTYLYVYNGWLKELTIRDDTTGSLEAGKNIIEANDLQIQEFSASAASHTYQITVTNLAGEKETRILTERSSQ